MYPTAVPFTPGSEGAGVVVAIGDAVTDVAVGDRVASQNFTGAYAELALARADRLVPLPDGLSARDGAAAMLQGMTAHYLTHATYRLQAGDFCLVHAGAGGVGLLLCQMSRRIGARVIATAGGPDKERLAREAGAEETIDYRTKNVAEEVRRITGGKGVKVVYDSIGKTTFDNSLTCLAPRGILASFGESSGDPPPVTPRQLGNMGSLYVTHPSLIDYTATRAELLETANDLFAMVVSGNIKIDTTKSYPLHEAAQAHRDVEARKTTGSVVLIP